MNADFDSEESPDRDGPVAHQLSPTLLKHILYLDSLRTQAGRIFLRDKRIALRVIAGKYRSRPLRSLRGLDIRPTSDRLRETLFNILTAGNPDALQGSVWLDLFAGTGAVGIEALSRGAARVYFVEASAAAAKVIHANLGSLKIASGAEVIQSDTAKALARLRVGESNPDFVFLDPPYRTEQAYRDTLNQLGGLSWLKTTAIVIAEHLKKFDPGGRFGSLARFRTLHQGDAGLSFYRLSTEPSGPPKSD